VVKPAVTEDGSEFVVQTDKVVPTFEKVVALAFNNCLVKRHQFRHFAPIDFARRQFHCRIVRTDAELLVPEERTIERFNNPLTHDVEQRFGFRVQPPKFAMRKDARRVAAE
jgi:hypothetical protein